MRKQPPGSHRAALKHMLWQFKTWHLPATKGGRAKMATLGTWLGGTSCCELVVAGQAGPAGAASGPNTAGCQTRWGGLLCEMLVRGQSRQGVMWLEEEQSPLGAGRGRVFTTARGLRLAMVCPVGVE